MTWSSEAIARRYSTELQRPTLRWSLVANQITPYPNSAVLKQPLDRGTR